MARGNGKRGGLSGQALKSFRHSVSILKSKGLTSKRVDARSQKATRYMQAKVKRLSGIIENTQVGVKVSPSLLSAYKRAGFEIVNRRVIVNKTKDEIAATRSGHILLRRCLGGSFYQEQIVLPYSAKNMHDLQAVLITDELDKMLCENEHFAFKYHGSPSYRTFATAADMLEWLQHYETLWSEEADDNFEHLIFYRVIDEGSKWGRDRQPRGRRVRTMQDRRGDKPRLRDAYSRRQDATRKAAKRKADPELRRQENARRIEKYNQLKADPVRLAKERERNRVRKAEARKASDLDDRNGYSGPGSFKA